MSRLWIASSVFAAVTMQAGVVHAATVPAHDPLTIVIVSDQVNPNGLSDAQLTQPGDLRDALSRSGSGLNIASVDEFDSGCVDDAIAALQTGNVDVFMYFAHRSAQYCGGGGQGQVELTDAVEQHLQAGGGAVVFHHGIYTANGKQDILQLLGGIATRLNWNEGDGQDVINVAPEHFVTSNGVEYGQNRMFGDTDLGVNAANYALFNNTPDERYPGIELLTRPGEDRTMLFASDYQGAQVLGYDLHRPDWAGHVVFYQPGEYQPNALDDVDGVNFQILANAVYYVATIEEEPSIPPDSGSSDGEDEDGNSNETDGAGSFDDSGDSMDADEASDEDAMTLDSDAGTDTSTVTASVEAEGSASCSCQTGRGTNGVGWLALVALAATMRRRRNRS